MNTNLLFTFTFISILLTWIYLHLTRNFNYWKNLNIPYRKPIVFFGNLFPVLTWKIMMGMFLFNLHKSTTAPFIGFFCFDQPFLLVRDLETIKHICVKDFDSFSDRTLADNSQDISTRILFILKNPVWRQLRLKLTSVFSSGKIKNLTYLIVNVSKTLTQHISNQIENRRDTPARELSMKFSTDVISSCVFGIDADSLKNENAEFRRVSIKMFENTITRGIQVVSYFFSPFLVRFFNMKFFDVDSFTFLKNVVKETINYREQTNENRRDLVDQLMRIMKNEISSTNGSIGKDIIQTQGVQLFAAGFETVGSTIFFLLHELSFHPEMQERLYKEINATLDKHGKFSYDAVQEMAYLSMLVSEGLRRYPVLSFLDRRCLKDFKVPNSDLVIKKGMPVYISLYGLHHDSEHFPNPFKFDPERFDPQNADNFPRFAYMPFGKGLRNCIGARFAIIAVKVAIVALMGRYKMEPTEGTEYVIPFNPKGFLLAPPADINIKFINRDYINSLL